MRKRISLPDEFVAHAIVFPFQLVLQHADAGLQFFNIGGHIAIPLR